MVLVSALGCEPALEPGASSALAAATLLGTGPTAYWRLLDACSYGTFGWAGQNALAAALAPFASVPGDGVGGAARVLEVDLPCRALQSLGGCDDTYPYRLAAAVSNV